MPALTEIEIQAEQNDPPICINFSSFLDESICSVPDLEELPNPDMTEIPSFLGQNYQTRDCGRVLRSQKNLCPLIIPFQCKYAIIHLSIDHPFIQYSSFN